MFFLRKVILWWLLLPLIANGTAFDINAGLSGTWHDNKTPGQGLIIDVMPANNSLFAGWFTYLPDEDGGRNQYWLTALGPFDGSLAELTLYETNNGQFNTTTAVEHIPVGYGTLQFHDCTTAQFNFYFESRRSTAGVRSQICRRKRDHKRAGKLGSGQGLGRAWRRGWRRNSTFTLSTEELQQV